MSNFSKIIIIILMVLTFFFIKEKFGMQIENLMKSLNITENIKLPQSKSKVNKIIQKEPKKEDDKTSQEKTNKNTAYIYFLALDSNDNGIYKKVEREVPKDRDKLEYAIEELIKGPGVIEKTMGAYSEIPPNTKIISIKKSPKKVVINLNSEFQYGGGTDSIYSRMMQLIKTAVTNTKGAKIYLYLDGKEVNTLGGEGIMISQPLNEKSLEI